MSINNNRLRILNTIALFGALYCIVVSFVMSTVCLVRAVSYDYLMNGVWSMAFSIAAVGLLLWRFKRFNAFAKKFGISLIIIAILIQIFNVIYNVQMYIIHL